MNTVLTLALAVSGGLINILLVLFLLAAAVLIFLAVYLIRRSHSTTNKQAYEQQAAQHLFLDGPRQNSGMLQSMVHEQEQQGSATTQSKQCPFCGTDVLPGGLFCLHCGQRLPASAQVPRTTPSGTLLPFANSPSGPLKASGSISSSRTLVSASQEIDDAHVRAIEEHPTLIGDVVVTAVPEKQEPVPAIEEWPTLIETAVVPRSVPAQQDEAHKEDGIQQPGYLILRKLNGKEVREYVLNKPSISIGRAPSNDIVVPRDKLTSRHHATVRYEDGHYALYDAHSANGTFLNGDEIEAGAPYAFSEGDIVGIGAYEFVYHTSEALMKEIARLPTVSVEALTNSGPLENSLSDVSITEQMQAEGDFHTIPAESGPAQETSVGSETQVEREAETAPEATPEAVSEVAPSAEAVVTEAAAEPVVTPAISQIPATPLAVPETLLEHLRFTAFHPKEVGVDTWNTLLIYTYIESALEDIYRDVTFLQREMESGVRKLSGRGKPLLPHGINITIVPECRGVLFNPKRVTLQWSDDWHRSIFRFYARRDLAGLSRNGRINIFAGPLLVATLRMAMLFEEEERLDPLDTEDADISTKPYERVFVSYSHQDKTVMRACQDIYHTLGFDALAKIDQVRDSEVLQEAVRKSIEEAEIFQLFWSEHSAKSESVKREWEYALQLNRGESFLRPVYWEVPLIPPPDTLGPFYFSYLPAYAFSSS